MDNYEIEQTLLGKLMVEPELIDKYSQLIHENLFEHEFNRSTYHAIMELKSKNRTVDILTVSKLKQIYFTKYNKFISYNFQKILVICYYIILLHSNKRGFSGSIV